MSLPKKLFRPIVIFSVLGFLFGLINTVSIVKTNTNNVVQTVPIGSQVGAVVMSILAGSIIGIVIEFLIRMVKRRKTGE